MESSSHKEAHRPDRAGIERGSGDGLIRIKVVRMCGVLPWNEVTVPFQEMESGGEDDCKVVKHMRCHGTTVDLVQTWQT